MTSYFGRICWNSAHWIRPTGEAADAESDTYATRLRYGHEEWLFNYQWVLDGWKYAFLQPVNRSIRKVSGSTIDVRLYTISPHADWFYVAHLPSCEVLTESLAETARKALRARGWLRDMEAQVRAIGGDVAGLRYENPLHLYNVRFRPAEAEIYDPIVKVGATDAVRGLRRYTLTELTAERRSVASDWARTVAAANERAPARPKSAAKDYATDDPVYDQLRSQLQELLEARHGREAVEIEHDGASLQLRVSGLVTLFELRIDPRPRRAIREALGPLLERAYRARQRGDDVHNLVVAAPGELAPADREYMEFLRREKGLGLHYLCVRRGMNSSDV